MNYTEILSELRRLSDEKAIAGMARFGITPKKTFGVPLPQLRRIAKQTGKNNRLAEKLWASGIREMMIIASLVAEPVDFSGKQMDEWAGKFDYWEICDQVCMNLFGKTSKAYSKSIEWAGSKQEFVKRAGFVLMARLAVGSKEISEERFDRLFALIKRESVDERKNVKKAVNWALRQIGKKSLSLNRKAIKTGRQIQELDSKSAQWIAKDALKELESTAVKERLERKK